MFLNQISQTLSTAQAAAIENSVNDIKLILSWLINLTPKDRQKLLKMGSISEPFVRGVLEALKANPSAVPASFDVAEFAKDLALFDVFRRIAMLLLPLTEGLNDTTLLLGSELIKQANAGYAILQKAAQTNSPLSEIVKNLGKRYQHKLRAVPKTFAMEPLEQRTLHGVVPLRMAKALVGGPFKFFKGSVAGDVHKLVAASQPGKIPKGWTTVTVINLSESIGVFSLIQD